MLDAFQVEHICFFAGAGTAKSTRGRLLVSNTVVVVFSEKLWNRGMLCALLAVLISSGQYRLK